MKSKLQKGKFYQDVIVLFLLILASSGYSHFNENPVYFLSGNNSFAFSIMVQEQTGWNLGVYWRQIERTLFGELGYTTDSTYATGVVNYRLVDISKFYALNIKFKILPLDAKMLSLDAGGLIKVSDSSILSFAVYNLVLYSEKQENSLPSLEAVFNQSVTNQTGVKIGVSNIGVDYLRFTLGIAISKIAPFNEIIFSYVPVYSLSGGTLYHSIYGKTNVIVDNYIFELSGFYNLSENISNYEELKSKYGLKITLAFNM
jgi:hypothetical protein